ncbi:hypothetical protein [Bacillus niameyensis]|uniref:hypothetical protein n=1 Tax=Bacillus niameyensis TaxID=1522308 RepID=UPI00084101E2|nr:hypothetical protein [Bacillus niameyensis]
MTISKKEENLFNNLLENSLKRPDKTIDYKLAIPKYKFLYYATKQKSFVLHGSNNKYIDSFEPRKQTLYNGKWTTAVFATKDPIWPIFYAIFNKEKIVGNMRNGSVSANGKKPFHFYSLTKPTLQNEPWTNGMIYLLQEDSFRHISQGTIQFDEWISDEAIEPIAKIEVEPDDFYFLNKVATHRSDESVMKAWLFYKIRSLLV